jgi:tetratricopeptide (TPR) repeat protein
VTLLPILLIVPSKSALEISEVNDRYLYLAMLGPFFIVAWFLERLPAKRRSEDRRSKDDGGDASRRLAVQDTMDREAAVPPPARSKETGSPRAMARGDGGEAGRSHDLVVPGERFRPAGLVAVAAIALVLMVLTWRQSAIWRDSLTLWNHVVTAYPQQHIAWRQRGEARRKARVFVAAESDYRRALSLAPHDEAALRHLVMMTLSRGDTATAESMLSEAIGRAAMDTANLLFLRGRLRLDDGEMAAAIEDFNAALRANPAHVDALVNRGIARLELGEDEAALFDLDKVLRLDDSVNYREAGFQIRPPPARLSAAERDRPVGQRLVFGMAYFTRGVILERRRESIKALLDFNQAARYDPHNPDVYYNRGLALLSLNLETEAYRDFTSARSARPRDPAIANNLAIATAKLGRTREAMALFERLLIDHPDHVETLSNLGLALLQLGEHAAAERHFTRAIELAPTAVEAWSGRGVCRTASGDLRGAIADLTRAITLSGGSAQLFANRAQAQAQSGNFRAALADLDRADALAPGEPAILHGRAWMLANLGRKRDARDVLERIRAAGHPVDPGLLRELTP